jgi:hypothetical protein
MCRSLPFIKKIFADSGYAGDRPATATIIAVEMGCKPTDQIGFAVLRANHAQYSHSVPTPMDDPPPIPTVP